MKYSISLSYGKWWFQVYLRERGYMQNYYCRPLFGLYL